jgi:hypothetical protein
MRAALTTEARTMGDVIFLGLGLGAFALFALYADACGRGS